MIATSWVGGTDGTDFPVQNLPFGVFESAGHAPRVGVALGEFVIDLARLDVPYRDDFEHGSLNPFLARGRAAWTEVREAITALVTDEAHSDAVEPHLRPRRDVTLRLPIEVADYVDFYSSMHHATNVGRIFRPDSEPLTPNWKHLPIGYHGRAGTVVVSGTPIVRPMGQRKAPTDAAPTYGPTLRLDIEAELGFVVGVPTGLGDRVGVDDFAEHVFGVVLLNDWSARDVQSWETVPLGPFLGKSFATSISAWVVPLAALEQARVTGPPQDPVPLPYLRRTQPWGLDIDFEVEWNGTVVSTPPFGQMYWTGAQQLAHMTVNGAALRTGDLFGSGTVSGPAREQRGSFLELSWGGTEPVRLGDGSTRTFLEDGDTVTIRAGALIGSGRIGFGEVTGTVHPARQV